jgi:hypothetical protein
MPEPVGRAQFFRNRAEECLRVADLAWSDELRDRYRAKAGAYEALADAELSPSANHPPPDDKAEQPLSDAVDKSSSVPPATSSVTSGVSEIGMPQSAIKPPRDCGRQDSGDPGSGHGGC